MIRTANVSLPQAQNAALEAQANTELDERIKNLEHEVARYKEDSGKAQAEVDRLLEILREMENEKNDKDKKINELERWVQAQSTVNVCDNKMEIQNEYKGIIIVHILHQKIKMSIFLFYGGKPLIMQCWRLWRFDSLCL